MLRRSRIWDTVTEISAPFGKKVQHNNTSSFFFIRGIPEILKLELGSRKIVEIIYGTGRIKPADMAADDYKPQDQ